MIYIKRSFAAALLLCAAIIFSSCAGSDNSPAAEMHMPDQIQSPPSQPPDFPDGGELAEYYFTTVETSRPVDGGLIDFAAQFNPDIYSALFVELTDGTYSESLWYALTKHTLAALYSLYTADPDVKVMDDGDTAATLAFTGDICLADDWYNMTYFHRYGDGTAASCFDESLISRMRAADILTVNNEFTFSTRGTPTAGKQFTFRASPANVSILLGMGTDVASLANNHCFDYGADAFADTLTTLADAGITYVGAGADLDEAAKPRYFIAGGVKIAIVAATRAEKYVLTPEATDESGGVMRMYDETLFLETVREAKANADYVVAFLHWGAENSARIEAEQPLQAEKIIAAGADVIVGTHTHCLQGVAYIDGCPVVYSLGNFWFNLETVDTALLEITIESNGAPRLRIVPCIQSAGKTSDLSGSPAGARILEYIASLSPNAVIADDGTVSPSDSVD